VLAVFDLDGTLTTRDSFMPFMLYVAGPWRFLVRLPAVVAILAAMALRLLSRQRAKEAVLSLFVRGMPEAQLRQLGEDYAHERLPALLRPQAMERLAWHRRKGHRCALASASPAIYVEPWGVAAGFDEVFATRLEADGRGVLTGRIAGENCRGEEKVRRLQSHYGELGELTLHGYGDSPSDRPLLARCAEAHYRPFRSSGKGIGDDTAARRNSAKDLLKLMRPHQWLKNAFVLVGVVFGHAWAVPELLTAALLAAAAFCLTASAIYIMNDFVDRERDKLHPKKRNRPIASGRVTAGGALGLAAVLALAAAGLAWAASPAVLMVIGAYAAMNVAYSLALKSVVILDVFIIATGFILRILAGTLAIGIAPSQWLLVCSLLLTLFLGFTKRRSELLSLSSDFVIHRQALLHYNAALLDKLIGICACGAIMSYSLYAMSPDTARIHGTPNLIYTVPFVLYGMFRYLYLLHAKQAGADTSRDLVRDVHLIAAVTGWLGTTLWLIY
jgi:HAD superfamily hydrolase (TIGR01490 family)